MKNAKDYILFPWAKQSEITLKTITKAEGIFFWTLDKKYFDMSSQSINVNIGHGNKIVINAIKEQYDILPYVYSSFCESARIEAANRIIDISPKRFKKVFFTNTGAESNENAIKIARTYTRRHKIFSAYQSYHGATLGAGNITGDQRRFACEPSLSGFVKYRYPSRYHNVINFKTDIEMAEYHLHILKEQIIYEGPDNIAAIFIEPIIGSNGVIIPPDGYLQGIRRLCDEYGILMISDEVMTGWGRTGKWFAVEHWEVSPDIITTSKGLTSSYFPLGAILVNESIAEYYENNYLSCGSTNYAHPVGCAAASANIDIYRQGDLINNSKNMGNMLENILNNLKENHPTIGDVRSKGLFSAIEFVKDINTKEPHDISQFMNMLYKNGFSTLNRRNILIIAPPLIICKDELLESMAIVDNVLTELKM